MEKKILVKELDRYKNIDKTKVISEYIIYYVVDNNNVEAHIEIGEANKTLRVNSLLSKYFDNLTIYPVEEITLL